MALLKNKDNIKKNMQKPLLKIKIYYNISSKSAKLALN